MFTSRSKVRVGKKSAVAVEVLWAQHSITDGHDSVLAQEINLFFGFLLLCFLTIEGHYCCIIFCKMSPELKKKILI